MIMWEHSSAFQLEYSTCEAFLCMLIPSPENLDREKIKFEALFHYATIGIVISNYKGEITHINSQAEQIFGFESGELLGQTIEVLLPENVRERHKGYRRSYTYHPEVRPMGAGRDLIARRKDGSEFPVEVSLSYFHCEDGLFVIAYLQDITLRKQRDELMQQQKVELEGITNQIKQLNSNLEKEVEKRTKDLTKTLQQLEASRAELENALEREKQLGELKSRFVTMASHEFKTPLSTILTSATLISKYKTEAEQDNRDKHLKRIGDSVQHLTNLLNEFLSLGKLDEGKVGIKAELVDLGSLVNEVASELKEQLKNQQTIDIQLPEQKVICKIDPNILRNILNNLLSNAIKFSPENKPISIKVSKNKKNLVLEVKDHGLGIPEEDQKHLFSRFFRAKNVETIKGTGLGLHIVQRYIELMGGSIQFESKIGEGTTFLLFFPLE